MEKEKRRRTRMMKKWKQHGSKVGVKKQNYFPSFSARARENERHVMDSKSIRFSLSTLWRTLCARYVLFDKQNRNEREASEWVLWAKNERREKRGRGGVLLSTLLNMLFLSPDLFSLRLPSLYFVLTLLTIAFPSHTHKCYTLAAIVAENHHLIHG